VAGCLRRGVPPEILLDSDARKVKTTRAVGLGSESAKRFALNNMMAQRGSMDELSRRNAERDWSAAMLGGYSNVDRYFPTYDRSKKPSAEAAIATLENNDFMEGASIPVGYDQVHASHIPVHFGPLVQVAQAFLQDPNTISPQKALQLYQQLRPHLVLHIQYLAGDPSREEQVKGYLNVLKQLDTVFKKIQAAAQQILNAQDQQAQQAVAERQKLERKASQMELDLAVRKYEIDRKMELEVLDLQGLNATRLAKMEASILAKLQETNAKIQNEARLTQAKLDREAAKNPQ
jgi:hypothetical protein